LRKLVLSSQEALYNSYGPEASLTVHYSQSGVADSDFSLPNEVMTHPDKIKVPPSIPTVVMVSPIVRYANRDPHSDMLVIRMVSSVADTTDSAIVSNHSARAVETRPVQAITDAMNGSASQDWIWLHGGRLPAEVTTQYNMDPAAIATS
jgi:hypothetical protein